MQESYIENLVGLIEIAGDDGDALLQRATHYVEEAHHILAIHEPAVEQEQLELIVLLAHFGRRHLLYNSTEYLLDIETGFGTDFGNSCEAELGFDLLLDFRDVADHVYLVHHWNYH